MTDKWTALIRGRNGYRTAEVELQDGRIKPEMAPDEKLVCAHPDAEKVATLATRFGGDN